MLARLPGPLLGALMATLLVLNTLAWAIPVYICILIKLLCPPGSALRPRLSQWMADLAQGWAHTNTALGDALLPIRWDIRNPVPLRADGQYLVCCNHQSWNDIYAVIKGMGKDAPFFKFFLKQELIWVPVLGLVWWGLDYPFMKRQAARTRTGRDGRGRNQDLEATRRACERFRHQPALVLNFLEGTRFTPAKQASQRSPYQHLLKPKSGGFALALATLGDRLHSLLDVTVVYPQGSTGLWGFLTGRLRQVIIEVRELPIPEEFLRGGYDTDAEFRRRFQQWIAGIWDEKDRRISELLVSAR